MITCRELAELLFDYTSEQLPPERRQGIEQHLDACRSCGAFAESYQITVRLTRQLPHGPLPPSLAEWLQAVLGTGGATFECSEPRDG
jgi:hypothetical protein